VCYTEGAAIPLLIGGLVLGVWLTIALLEILAPGPTYGGDGAS
jgi:hypothetical protein